MKAILVRVGVDHVYGHWNAPADPASRHFVYCPIPDSTRQAAGSGRGKYYRAGCRRDYAPYYVAFEQFLREYAPAGMKLPHFPLHLLDCCPHVDPDFEYLTFGDNGERRGSGLKGLRRGDLLVFYAGLRSLIEGQRLIYALIGLYVVDKVTLARSVPATLHDHNAHTRWTRISKKDIIVWADPRHSGRLLRYILIGEWRDRAYRVRRDILKAWGGLSVKGGYIQRSGVPPRFLDPERFCKWFQRQGAQLVKQNN